MRFYETDRMLLHHLGVEYFEKFKIQGDGDTLFWISLYNTKLECPGDDTKNCEELLGKLKLDPSLIIKLPVLDEDCFIAQELSLMESLYNAGVRYLARSFDSTKIYLYASQPSKIILNEEEVFKDLKVEPKLTFTGSDSIYCGELDIKMIPNFPESKLFKLDGFREVPFKQL